MVAFDSVERDSECEIIGRESGNGGGEGGGGRAGGEGGGGASNVVIVALSDTLSYFNLIVMEVPYSLAAQNITCSSSSFET
eukprot:CAMPEP_0197599350 /NCGR_PEP_ID=MMETSP1326-20131121/31196_1 /TAXON_ID=1155430 /ORGANISM="Genus nov. species nov., Strain RCC2288" /LENGTH=80 /DNA_ID=CAMNT_0043166299 /DNA_START=56 /DNA_END=295 /DNA_ORIENTATION=+